MKKMMNAFLFGSFAVLLFSSNAAYAQESYQTELSASYFREDADPGSRAIINMAELAVYFAPVQTRDHPYAEAAFLERIGSVNFMYGRIDTKTDGILKGDGNAYDLSINYTTPDFPVVIAAGWMQTGLEYHEDIPAWNAKSKMNNYYMTIGKFFAQGLFAAVGYAYVPGEATSSPSPWTSDLKYQYNEYSIAAKYVKETGGGRAINMEALLERDDFEGYGVKERNYEVSLLGDYYFTRGLSAGAGVTSNNAAMKSEDGKTYSADIRFFVTPRLSIKAGYERFLNDHNGQSDSRNYEVNLAARF